MEILEALVTECLICGFTFSFIILSSLVYRSYGLTNELFVLRCLLWEVSLLLELDVFDIDLVLLFRLFCSFLNE
jgi:hypothetical protein